MFRIFLFLAALFGATGVMLGAFGAHGLKPLLTPERFEIYQTAVSYQIWHALALIGVALVGATAQLRLDDGSPDRILVGTTARSRTTALKVSGIAFTLGILLFSGSLYLLVLLDRKILGAITPLGGLMMIIGWLALAFAAIKQRKD